MPFTVTIGDGRRHGWGCIHAISAYQHKPPSNKPQPELRVQQCRGDRRGHGPPVAATTTASLGLRACSGPIARPTGRAHLPAGCAEPGRILPCPRFSGVGLPKSVEGYRDGWIAKGRFYTEAEREAWGRSLGLRGGVVRRAAKADRDERIIEGRVAGLSYRKLAQLFKLDYATVWHIVNRGDGRTTQIVRL